MKNKRKYRISVEDETRLEKVVEISATPARIYSAVIVSLLLIMAVGAFVAFLTPIRTLMPGYLKASERAASEMQLLRLDSLRLAYEKNSAFLLNMMDVIDQRATSHTAKIDTTDRKVAEDISPDSILIASEEETRFVNMMREREKYNISVVAPLAAESLMFSEINGESVFSESSKTQTLAEVIMARGSSVASVADGTVIAVSQTIRDGGSTVIIQHPRGFLSRISRLGTVFVAPGDNVKGGQIIARANRGNARRGEVIHIELWHNGDPLVPFEYIGDRDAMTSRNPYSPTNSL